MEQDDFGNDFWVESVAYNGHIIAHLQKCGFIYGNRTSITKFIENGMGLGFQSQEVGANMKVRLIKELIGLQALPVDEGGEWLPIVTRMAAALCCRPDDLFPGELKHKLPLHRSSTVSVDIGEQVTWLVM